MKFTKKFFSLLKDKDKRAVAHNFVSLIFLQGANYILPLLVLPYLVRILGAEKFGLVMFSQSLILFLTVFVDYGFNISGTREISINRGDKKELSKIFSAIIIIKIGLILVALVLLFMVVELFTRFSIDAEVYYLSFGVTIGQALFPVWFFQGIEKMKFVTLINILAKVITTILIFVIIRVKSDYILVPIFYSLGYIVAGVFGLFLCLKYVNFKLPSIGLMKRLLVDSTSLFVSNFATSLYTACNVFILGLFAGNTIAGIYSSMEKLILAIKNVYTPLYQALYPWVARQTDLKKVMVIKSISPFVFFTGLVLTLLILIFGKEILLLIYNDPLITEYAIIFKILGFISIFSGMNMLYNMLYFPSIKRYKVRMNILIVGGIFNIVMNLIFVQFYGIYGLAIIVASTELLLLILGYYFFKKLQIA